MQKTSYTGKLRFLDLYYGSYPNEDCKLAFQKDELILLCDDTIKDALLKDKEAPKVFYFTTVKQAYLALKMHKYTDFLDIYNAESAFSANEIAKKKKLRPDMKYLQEDLMRSCVEKKFEQHPDLLKRLINTTESLSYKSIYADRFFGIKIDKDGKTISGRNKLGQIYSQLQKKYMPKEMYSFSDKYDNTAKEFASSCKDNFYFVVDTETTGFSNEDTIIELSAIKVDGNTNEIVDEFDTFINPGYPLPKDIIKFNEKNETGITQEVIDKEGVEPKVALEEFKTFIGENALLLGHNFDGFDVRMLKNFYKKYGNCDFTYDKTCDTYKIAKDNIAGSHKLGDLFDMVKNKPKDLQLHRSIDDVKATLVVYTFLLDKINQKEIDGYKFVLNNRVNYMPKKCQFDKEMSTFISNTRIVVTKNDKKYQSVDIPALVNDIKEVSEKYSNQNIYIPFVENEKVKMILDLPNQVSDLILDSLARQGVYGDNVFLYNFKKVGKTFPHINEDFKIKLSEYLIKNNFLEKSEEIKHDDGDLQR